jgi:uncharacterized membrane protein YcjF (UPF0283 family)
VVDNDPVRDHADLITRAAEAKQSLLMALKFANAAALDGSQDAEDAQTLGSALDQVKRARDLIEVLHRRLEFLRQLDRIARGTVSDESSRQLISLVRLGVDGGYDVTEVRRMIDTSLGRRT